MKRCLSLLVAFVLLMSLLPGTALGSDTQQQEAPGNQIQVLPSALPGESSGEPEEALPETQAVLQEPVLLEDVGQESLRSGDAIVSGTVSLPGGSTALGDGDLYVYLCAQPVLDKNGQVLVEPVNVTSRRVGFTQGQSTGSFVMDGVEPGTYVLEVYSRINTGSALGGELYFNADGTPVGNPYAATVLNVGAGTTSVNLTLPAAPRSISGAVTLEAAAEEDISFDIYCYSDNSTVSYSSSVTVGAGADSANFSIGVEEGQYYLQFRNSDTGAYGVYNIYGNVTGEYDQRMPVSVEDCSVDGLQVDCTSLLGGSSGGEGGQPAGDRVPVQVTVQLPAPLSEEKEYEVCLMNDEGYTDDSVIYYVDAGKEEFSAEFWTEEGKSFRVAYSDVTGCTRYYIPATGARYAAENGITTQISTAKVFTGGTDVSVTIAEPSCYTVTGTLSRSGDTLPKQAAYVLAEFDDGETYAGRAVFAFGETSANYTIYVPQSQQGNAFSLTVGKALSGTGSQVNDTTLSTGGSDILTGNIRKDLAILEEVPTIAGTLSLPSGYTAPKDGLVITLGVADRYNEKDYATYYLPEGKSSIPYTLNAPVTGSTVVYAELSSPTEGYFRRAAQTFSQNELFQADLTFPETVTISGTITVPESCRQGVALISLYTYGDLNGSGTYVSGNIAIPTGMISMPFSLAVPKNMILQQMSVRVDADTTGVLNTSSLYLQSDLSTFADQYANLNINLTEDLELSIPLSQGIFVSGTISLAQGLQAGSYSGTVWLESVDSGMGYSEYFEFTGESCSYQISLPGDTLGEQYYLSIYLYEGEGTVLDQYYYYAESGMTTDQGSANPITLGESGATIDLTIPRGKVISGRLVADDGGKVTWEPEVGLTLWLEAVGEGSGQYLNVMPDARGNWSATVASDFTGTFKLHTYIDSGIQTNILPETYYYRQGGRSTHDALEATPITLGEEDLTGLELYVETGWILSGHISLPEGGYISGGTVPVGVSIQTADGSYSGYRGRGTVGSDGGSYFAAVPKEEAQYAVCLNSVTSLPDGVSSNLYWGDNLTLEPVTITGDTDGLDFTLAKARSVITGTVYRPEGYSGALNLTLYVQVSRESSTYAYNGFATLSARDDSANFSIAIPETETSEQYQLCYIIYNGTGVLSGHDVYLCSDGSLSTDPAQAGSFSLDHPQVHEFAPLTVQPFATGRIYCPEELTEPMSIVVDYRPQSGISTMDLSPTAMVVNIGPNIGQQDENGRWYSTYALSGLEVGSAYKLTYYSYDNSDVVDTNWHYINTDGAVVSSAGQATVYTVPNVGSNVVNFTPILWDEGSEDYVLQSEHGMKSLPQAATYTYRYPGADSLNVTFSSRTDMNLKVNESNYGSNSLAGNTIQVTGDTLTVVLDAFDYQVEKFGFAVEKVEPLGVEQTPVTGAAAVYTESGSTEKAVLTDAKAGEVVRVSLVGQESAGTRHSLLGALYGADGALLDFVQVPVTFNDAGVCTTSLCFDAYGQAVTLKLFLIDQDWAPEMANLTFTE